MNFVGHFVVIDNDARVHLQHIYVLSTPFMPWSQHQPPRRTCLGWATGRTCGYKSVKISVFQKSLRRPPTLLKQVGSGYVHPCLTNINPCNRPKPLEMGNVSTSRVYKGFQGRHAQWGLSRSREREKLEGFGVGLPREGSRGVVAVGRGGLTIESVGGKFYQWRGHAFSLGYMEG